MTTLTELPRAVEAIISEADGFRSRDPITIMASQTLLANSVLGRAATAATVAAAVAVAGNTGNATIALGAPAFIGATQIGTYRVVFNSALRFAVFDQSGANVGNGLIGTAFSNQIVFTATAGATPMIAGDTLTIAVTAATFQFGIYDPAATDGRAIPAGILYDAVTTAVAVTAPAVAFVRAIEVAQKKLQWFTGASAPQIATGVLLLNRLPVGITVRP